LWIEIRQFNKTTKEGTIIITTTIITKKCKTSDTQYNFSHSPMTDCTASPQAAIAELADFADLTELAELTKLTEESSCPLAKPIHKLSVTSMVWNISTGQLGLAAWLCSLPAPAHLLLS